VQGPRSLPTCGRRGLRKENRAIATDDADDLVPFASASERIGGKLWSGTALCQTRQVPRHVLRYRDAAPQLG